MPIEPWDKAEGKEIARLRKAGRGDSYILGQMKVQRHSNAVPPVTKRGKPMATKKATGKKKAPTKKKVTKKTPSRKTAGKKVGRKKGGFQCGEKLTAVKGKDDSFYKQFPRYAAYQMICKAKTMATSDFVDAVEKLDKVKSRPQALGILTKLLEKECVKASGAVKKA